MAIFQGVHSEEFTLINILCIERFVCILFICGFDDIRKQNRKYYQGIKVHVFFPSYYQIGLNSLTIMIYQTKTIFREKIM